MKKCEECQLDRQYTQVMNSGRIICTGCYLEYYASQCDQRHRRHAGTRLDFVSGIE